MALAWDEEARRRVLVEGVPADGKVRISIYESSGNGRHVLAHIDLDPAEFQQLIAGSQEIIWQAIKVESPV